MIQCLIVEIRLLLMWVRSIFLSIAYGLVVWHISAGILFEMEEPIWMTENVREFVQTPRYIKTTADE